MPKVAIVAAMEREVHPLVGSWRMTAQTHSGRTFRFFLRQADEVVLVCGGIGAEAARRAAEAVIALYSPEVIWSVGFAGALDPALKVSDVLQPGVVVNAADGSRTSIANGQGVLVSFASVATPQQKARLREAYGAQLVDMEAAAVAHAAEARGVRFSAVKAVSDEFDFVFPAMERFVDASGSFRQARFAAYSAVRPWLWPKVLRIAGNSNRAARALCASLSRSLEGMTVPAER